MTDLFGRVGDAVDGTVVASTPLSGGDINDAYRVDLDDGRAVFAKTNRRAPDDMFEAEARGLQWLTESDALRIPAVLACGPDFLALEYIAPGPRARDFDERFGAGLAALHGSGAAACGLPYDNYLATLPQRNDTRPTWAEFYARQRLEPLVERAVDRGLGKAGWPADFERLFARLPELVGADERPARLHGDLWSGNVHVDDRGMPCLIDPAVYGGCREIDLAMLCLFGSPSERFFAAYDSEWPLAPGWRDRVTLYQLYPLLAHVCLFGGSYAGQTDRVLRKFL